MKIDWSTVAEVGLAVLLAMAIFKLLDALFIDAGVKWIKGEFEALTS